MLGMPLNVVHHQVREKHKTKESDRFHNHSNLLTMPEPSQLFVCHVKGPLSFVRKCRKRWLPQGRRCRRAILPSTQEWLSPHATYMWKRGPEAGLTSLLLQYLSLHVSCFLCQLTHFIPLTLQVCRQFPVSLGQFHDSTSSGISSHSSAYTIIKIKNMNSCTLL